MLLTVVGDILDSDIYVHPLKLAGNLRKEHRIYRAQPALSRGYGKIGKARRSVELSGEIEGQRLTRGLSTNPLSRNHTLESV